jgi:hypothetical protein
MAALAYGDLVITNQQMKTAIVVAPIKKNGTIVEPSGHRDLEDEQNVG